MTQSAFAPVSNIGGPLERMSTAQHVANALRDQLIHGELAPGTRLSDEQIAASLTVSRNTVREAIQILASEGLVRRSHHRGVVVTELSAEEIADVFQARRLVELAGIRGASGAPPAWLHDLHAVLDSMKAAVAAGSHSNLLEADLRFHETIVRSVNSERVSRFYHLIQTQIRLASTWQRRRLKPDVIIARHAAIVDALDAKDYARAEELVAHMVNQGEMRLHAGHDDAEVELEASEGAVS